MKNLWLFDEELQEYIYDCGNCDKKGWMPRAEFEKLLSDR